MSEKSNSKTNATIGIGCCFIPLAITCIVLAAAQTNKCHYGDAYDTNLTHFLCVCDYRDTLTHLTVGEYLLGLGIPSVVLVGLLIISLTCSLCTSSPIPLMFVYPICILTILFGFSWFIVGAITLYHDNIECIRHGQAHVIFALVMWILAAIPIAKAIFYGKHHSENHK